jgi:hypothetical protein
MTKNRAGSLFFEVGAGGLEAGAVMLIAMKVESKAKSSKDDWIRGLGGPYPSIAPPRLNDATRSVRMQDLHVGG